MIITPLVGRVCTQGGDEFMRLAPGHWYVRGRADDGFRRVHRRAQIEQLDNAFYAAAVRPTPTSEANPDG